MGPIDGPPDNVLTVLAVVAAAIFILGFALGAWLT